MGPRFAATALSQARRPFIPAGGGEDLHAVDRISARPPNVSWWRALRALGLSILPWLRRARVCGTEFAASARRAGAHRWIVEPWLARGCPTALSAPMEPISSLKGGLFVVGVARGHAIDLSSQTARPLDGVHHSSPQPQVDTPWKTPMVSAAAPRTILRRHQPVWCRSTRSGPRPGAPSLGAAALSPAPSARLAALARGRAPLVMLTRGGAPAPSALGSKALHIVPDLVLHGLAGSLEEPVTLHLLS